MASVLKALPPSVETVGLPAAVPVAACCLQTARMTRSPVAIGVVVVTVIAVLAAPSAANADPFRQDIATPKSRRVASHRSGCGKTPIKAVMKLGCELTDR